jgi:hypothetical protein
VAEGDRKRKSPREEKRLDLERQRRGFSEYAHALRHGKWKRKRRRTHSSYRSRVAALLDRAFAGLGHDVDPEDVDVDHVMRERIEKWSATPLGEWVRERLDRRVERVARSFFKQPYDREQHREPFGQVLTALVEEHDGRESRLGRRLERLLVAVDTLGAADRQTEDAALVRDAEWFRAFLQDEPAWREPLEAWLRGPGR